jgi:hypothetical protein
MNDSLTREICGRILEYVGILPYHRFGQMGLTTAEHQLPKEIWPTVEYETGQKVSHPLYGARAETPGADFRVLLLDLSLPDNQYLEFYLMFKLNQLPLHCLHYVAEQSSELAQGQITIFDTERQVWLASNTQAQASNLIGFDTLYSVGVLWDPQAQVEDLRQAVVDLLARED